MKRSELKRKTPLKHNGREGMRSMAERAGAPAWVNQALRRGRRKTYGTKAARWRWRQAWQDKPCAVCGGRSDDGHHVLRAQVLIREGHVALLHDVRNCLPTCRRCHGAHHGGGPGRIPRALIPATAWAFAEELGLGWVLEREYPVDV